MKGVFLSIILYNVEITHRLQMINKKKVVALYLL